MSHGLLHLNDISGEYPASYYRDTMEQAVTLPSLEGELECDVCVIGGGFTGLSTALHAAERGMNTILLEAHRVGWGASGRNGGQVGSGQRVSQEDLERRFGLTMARNLWDLAEDAKTLVRSLVDTHEIPCHLKYGVIHADHRARFVPKTHAEVAHLRKQYGYDQVHPLGRDDIRQHLDSGYYHGGAIDCGAMHLHPLNFALGVAKAATSAGARIFEHSRVVGIHRGARIDVRLAAGRVRCRQLVLGCNGYLDGLDGFLAARTMPINNFIIATEPLPEAFARSLIRDDTAVADSKFVVNYYRLSADHRMLFGGGESYGYRFPRDIKGLVRRNMLRVYPQLADTRIDYAWGGTLAITMSRLPCFARIDSNIHAAGGYSGHGVALATLAGQVLAESIGGIGGRMDLLSSIPNARFPGGRTLRQPLLALAMSWYAMRDRI